MEGIFKPPSGLALTPHKVSVCVLLQIYAPPVQSSVPFHFSSVSHHNRLGLLLLALTKTCEDVLEPRLEELIAQLREIGGHLNDWFCDNLTRRLLSFSSPDDLFNFFSDLRGILGGSDSSVVDDDQIILDPNGTLGLFLRRCLLAFNILSFEGVCHLMINIATYCKDAISSCPPYESVQGSCVYQELLPEYENMDLENFVFEKVSEEIEERKKANERVLFHNHAPRTLVGCVEDPSILAKFEVSPGLEVKFCDKFTDDHLNAISKSIDSSGYLLRAMRQIQGYLHEQADAIEKNGSSFPLNAFELVLTRIQKLAPELHRVHFLRFLNSLYHDDYPSALENLHRYFDYSAGTEGLDFVPPSSGTNLGRYEIAFLFLGMMHFHFGHPKQSLEVLTEAVRVSQQHGDDTCLAYTLAAICNLLSEVGISGASGILGSSYSPVISLVTCLAIQQQLLVLLKQSIRRAESLKLRRLVACNHSAMAKFDLMHVQRPSLSFGPKSSMKCRTCPVNVCKELRQTSHLMSDFSTENSVMMNDGAFSTIWLKHCQKPLGSLIFTQDNESGMKSNAFYLSSQQCSVPEPVLQVVGSSYLVRATAWEIYGSAPLARTSALIYATCYADSSRADAALAYAKLVQHLAVFKGYKEAFAALKVAEEKFLSVSKSRMLLLKLQLLHEHALHAGHLKMAFQLCNEFGVLASSVNGVDMELKTEASIRYARTLLAANQFRQAASVAHSLFCMCYKFNMQVENASILLLLADIHKRSGRGVLGIPYALASLTFSQSLNLDLLKVSAKLTLAELWLLLGSNHSKRASAIIHSALPMILGHGGLELRSRAFIAEAKCYLSDPSFSVLENPEMILNPLRQAADELEFLEYHELAAEAFYLMAIVFDKLRQLELREEAAASFKIHIIALENSQHEEPLLHTW